MRNGRKTAVAMGEREYRWLEKGLRKMGFFSKLDLRHLSNILPYMELMEFPRKATVCREGAKGDSFYLIYRGAVQVKKSGWDKPVAVLKPGEFFGEMALLFRQPRTATVSTVKPSRLFILQASDFSRMLKKNTSVARTIREIAEARRKELARS
ncbi:MAG: cyclic nucleotide-binding domain-containing protein [Elusimicrobia bacterium]|nr:cyclic nucleotide-binding domain-containing protein [Elusimicrobiota bacterium]